jgi:mono/diheme cytochrome c family protein
MSNSPTTRTATIAVALCVAWAIGIAAHQQADAPTPAAPYTAAQAERGKTLYGKACASCHLDDLRGAEYATGLVGEVFRAGWNGKTVEDLFLRVKRTMPQDRPDSLSGREYADVVSYILEQNGVPAGSTELSADPAVLRGVTIVVGPTPTPRP